MAQVKGRLAENSPEVCLDVFQKIVSDIFPDIIYLMKYLLCGQARKNMSMQLEEQNSFFYTKISVEAKKTRGYLQSVGTILLSLYRQIKHL